MAPRTQLSEAEWRVMNALWERHPASVRELHERTRLDTGWAYTTVKTILARLADKGVVRASSAGRRLLYEPLLERDEARRGALRGLLERAFDGAFGGLVLHLARAERLSEKERAALRALLEREDAQGQA